MRRKVVAFPFSCMYVYINIFFFERRKATHPQHQCRIAARGSVCSATTMRLPYHLICIVIEAAVGAVFGILATSINIW